MVGEHEPAMSALLPDTTPVDVLGLSTRAANALVRGHIETLAQLRALSDVELLRVRGLGVTCLQEIQALLATGPVTISGIERTSVVTTEATLDSRLDTIGRRLQELAQRGATLGVSMAGIPVRELAVTSGMRRSLRIGGIITLADLVAARPAQLLDLPSIGPTRLRRLLDDIDERLTQRSEPASTPTPATPTTVRSEWASDDAFAVALQRLQQCCLDRSVDPVYWPLARFSAVTPRRAVQFHAQGLFTLADLLHAGASGLLAVETMGATRTLQLLAAMSNEIGRVGEGGMVATRQLSLFDAAIPRTDSHNLAPAALTDSESVPAEAPAEALVSLLADLRDPQRRAIELRHGLRDGSPRTLAEVGAAFGVTRERARQLLVKAEQRLKHPSRFERRRVLQRLITHTLDSLGSVGTRDELTEQLRQTVELDEFSPAGVLDFVLQLGGSGVQLVEGSGRVELVTTAPLTTVSTIAEAVRALIKASDAPLSADSTIATLASQGYQPAQVAALVRAAYGATGDEWIGGGRRGRIREMARTILLEASTPLHFSEIATRIRARWPEAPQTDDRQVHTAMGVYPDVFAIRGRGVYALVDMDNAPRDQLIRSPREDGRRARSGVGDEIERLLRLEGRELAEDTLVERVLQTWVLQPHSVRIAMQRKERFYRQNGRVGLAEWRAAEWPAPTSQAASSSDWNLPPLSADLTPAL